LWGLAMSLEVFRFPFDDGIWCVVGGLNF
jgi:hypothetical protein